MNKPFQISAASAPALGDLRRAQTGDTIVLHADASTRRDWPRYMDAIHIAVTRGAILRRVR